MNWLSEYFAQRTSPLSLSMWVHPPLVLGPDGPVASPTYCLSYPGVNLVFTPAERIRRGDLVYDLPARYDMVAPLMACTREPRADGETTSFFREITLYAPSPFNPDFVMTINGELSFVPVFSPDGAPGFSGICLKPAKGPDEGTHMALPWTFQGYLSI
ncbi:hypothetical protein WT81_30450 [Burkholderia stagnalis]|uniref:hypothetical protein n=1 Tax=Burkholderia stagnalis TaxID=1503054 RepID=UPI00075FAD1E|nr:hypothetical protein [Burkholderia stagnalis]KWK49257.1 hypothetical protein WT81_30450 [Burkholderia stagnalis]KWK57390.1 hypothetical protein WT80_30615 [Burkholderia stagnalis]